MMSNKFIISLEGNDVSSSLPWIGIKLSGIYATTGF